MSLRVLAVISILSLCRIGITTAQIRTDFILMSDKADPHFAMDHKGYLHVSAEKSLEGAYYAVFDSVGNEIKTPERVSDYYLSQSSRIVISKNHVAVVWWQRSTLGDDMVGGLFDVNGRVVSENILFSEGCCLDRIFPDVSFLNDTTFIVTWSGDGELTPSEGVYGQLASTSGRKIGGNLQFSDHAFQSVDHGMAVVLRQLPGENFVIVWIDDHLGADRVFARFFFSDGTPKDDSFLISEDAELISVWRLGIGQRPDGGFTAVWSAKKESGWEIQQRSFWEDSTFAATSTRVSSDFEAGLELAEVDIAVDKDGTCIIVWTQRDKADSSHKIYGQRFSPEGTAIGNNFRISQRGRVMDQGYPTVALNNKKIYTIWSERPDSLATRSSTWCNILDFDNPTVAVYEPTRSVPSDFRLLQNYPNPFNPSTTIRYEIVRRSHVRLTIYNVMGEEIISLIDDEKVPGRYRVSWDGKDNQRIDMPSGIYFCKLSVDGGSLSRKILLIR